MTCVEVSELSARLANLSDEELAALGKMTRAQQELAEANRGLAGTAAMGIFGGLLDWDDMVSIGFIGICRATMEYRPELGWKFSTYATTAARQMILNELKRLGRLKQGQGRVTLWDPRQMEHFADDEPDHVLDMDQRQQMARIDEAMRVLGTRERDIIRRRRAGETLSSIGRDLGMSKERVRQLERHGERTIRIALKGGRS